MTGERLIRIILRFVFVSDDTFQFLASDLLVPEPCNRTTVFSETKRQVTGKDIEPL